MKANIETESTTAVCRGCEETFQSSLGEEGFCPKCADPIPEETSQTRIITLVMPRRIAWATAWASNGYIYRWSRWHFTRSLGDRARTLCDISIPHTKWITPIDPRMGDNRIKAGMCKECKQHNKDLAG